jgi:MtN3 and saliva related transmembrane protein
MSLRSFSIFSFVLEVVIMETVTLIGLVAACSTTVAFVPQVVSIVRSRNTQGISLSMYSIFTFGIFLWLTYGLMVGDLPIIVANGVTFVLALTVLSLTLYYKNSRRKHNEKPKEASMAL